MGFAKIAGNKEKLVYMLKVEGFHHSNRGDQQGALQSFKRAAEIARSTGDEARWRENMIYCAWIQYSMGKSASIESFKSIVTLLSSSLINSTSTAISLLQSFFSLECLKLG